MPAAGSRTTAPGRVPPAVAGLPIAGAGLGGAAIAIGHDHALLLVLALCVAAMLTVLLAWPQLALPVAVFLIWTNTPSLLVERGAPAVMTAVVPLILVAPLATSYLRGEPLTIDRTFVLLVVLLGVFAMSTAISTDPATGLSKTITLASEGVVLYFLIFNAIRTRAALQRAAWALLAAGAFLAVVAIFQQLTKTFDRPYFGYAPLDIAYALGKSDSARAVGPVVDANYFAQILLVTIALGMPILLHARRLGARLLAGGAVLTMMLALAYTYSRGATLALAVVIVAMVVARWLKLRQLVLVSIAAATLVLLVPGYRDRIASVADVGGVTARSGASNEADESARSRLTENIAAFNVFYDHPVLGVGPGSFGLFYQEYAARTGGEVHRATRKDAGKAPQREAHNLFLSMAAETGIAGLATFCAILFAAFTGLQRARRRWSHPDLGSELVMIGLLLAFSAYVLAGLFLTLAFERYFWLLLAVMGAAAYLARAEARRTERMSSHVDLP